MKSSRPFIFGSVCVAVALILITLSVERIPAASSLHGPGHNWVHLQGKLLCTACTVQELRTTLPAPAPRLYQLNHRLGPSVVEAAPGTDPLPYQRLWLRGADQLAHFLAAEENMFQHIEVSGLLREYMPTAAVLDFATVRVVAAERSEGAHS
jgi:hypothetical protein